MNSTSTQILIGAVTGVLFWVGVWVGHYWARHVSPSREDREAWIDQALRYAMFKEPEGAVPAYQESFMVRLTDAMNAHFEAHRRPIHVRPDDVRIYYAEATIPSISNTFRQWADNFGRPPMISKSAAVNGKDLEE